MVREYVELIGCGTIEAVIASLQAVKDELPPGCSGIEVRLRGDDVFGRHILLTYSRPETEAELEAERHSPEPRTCWFKRSGHGRV